MYFLLLSPAGNYRILAAPTTQEATEWVSQNPTYEFLQEVDLVQAEEIATSLPRRVKIAHLLHGHKAQAFKIL